MVWNCVCLITLAVMQGHPLHSGAWQRMGKAATVRLLTLFLTLFLDLDKTWLAHTHSCPRTLMLRTVFLTNTVAVLLNSSPTDLRAIPLKSRCLRISMCGFPCSTALRNSAIVNTYVTVAAAVCSTCLPLRSVTCKVPCC
jgi:hypothetical protein